uniref:R3H domain-containing protein 4 n=1 Tax=Anthurium amnicola TaxID=1678845 RepID=A0A1D1ZB64_9ARAE
MSIPLDDGFDNGTASDADGSDADYDVLPDEAEYRPISTAADSASDEDDSGYISTAHSNGGGPVRQPPPNPSFFYDRAENGVSHLDLNGDGMRVGGEEEEDEERAAEDEEREASMVRAFSEDESRRNAPLTPENAARIMEAMRGVSFPGGPPDWVERVPEDRWVDQLGGLRRGEFAPAPQS